MNQNSLFEQMTQISKAHAFDILIPSLREENEKLKDRVKYLEDLIKEYSDKILAVGKPSFTIHPIDKEIQDKL